MTLQLVYRFDVLALRFGVPLVPCMKAGLAYYFWWIEHQTGQLATAVLPKGQTSRSIGGTLGLFVQPGIAIMLDRLNPSLARVDRAPPSL